MIHNKKSILCPTCQKPADVTVHADGFDDTPPSFVMRITCSGRCEPKRIPMTPQQMHEHPLAGYPLSGWSDTKY